MRTGAAGGNIIFEFDSEIYSEQAVKSAIHDLKIAAHLSLRGQEKKIIQVTIPLSETDRTNIETKVYKAILDHQIRIEVQKEYGPIRKLILAQAFFPCENLEEILDGLKL